MQLVTYLRHGVYAKTKNELLPLLSGPELEFLKLSMHAEHYETRKRDDPGFLFRLLLEWTSKTLQELA